MVSTFSKTSFLPELCALFRLLTQSSSLIFQDWAVQCFLCSHLTTTRSLHLHEESKMHKALLGRCAYLQYGAWHLFDLNELYLKDGNPWVITWRHKTGYINQIKCGGLGRRGCRGAVLLGFGVFLLFLLCMSNCQPLHFALERAAPDCCAEGLG